MTHKAALSLLTLQGKVDILLCLKVMEIRRSTGEISKLQIFELAGTSG